MWLEDTANTAAAKAAALTISIYSSSDSNINTSVMQVFRVPVATSNTNAGIKC